MNQTYEEKGREIGSLENNPIKPAHYDGDKCLEAIKAATQGLDGFEGFCIGSVIKYSWRWKRKNGVEDLQKAKRYLEYLERYKGECSHDSEEEEPPTGQCSDCEGYGKLYEYYSNWICFKCLEARMDEDEEKER